MWIKTQNGRLVNTDRMDEIALVKSGTLFKVSAWHGTYRVDIYQSADEGEAKCAFDKLKKIINKHEHVATGFCEEE